MVRPGQRVSVDCHELVAGQKRLGEWSIHLRHYKGPTEVNARERQSYAHCRFRHHNFHHMSFRCRRHLQQRHRVHLFCGTPTPSLQQLLRHATRGTPRRRLSRSFSPAPSRRKKPAHLSRPYSLSTVSTSLSFWISLSFLLYRFRFLLANPSSRASVSKDLEQSPSSCSQWRPRRSRYDSLLERDPC